VYHGYSVSNNSHQSTLSDINDSPFINTMTFFGQAIIRDTTA